MGTAVVRSETPEEREYTRHLNAIDARQRRIVDLQADLSLFKDKLGQFSAEYHSRVGTLLVELDKIRLSIDAYAYRITRLEDDATLHPQDLERETHDRFSEQQEQVRTDEEDARSYESIYREDLKRSHLDERSEGELKSLFRALAKRFHPDLARTEAERQRCELTMKHVTAAFHERDVTALRGMLTETDPEDPTFETRPIGEKLVWAIREVSRLDGLIESLMLEHAALVASDLARLWQRQEAGEDILGRIEHTTREQIEGARRELDEVIVRFREVAQGVNYG